MRRPSQIAALFLCSLALVGSGRPAPVASSAAPAHEASYDALVAVPVELAPVREPRPSDDCKRIALDGRPVAEGWQVLALEHEPDRTRALVAVRASEADALARFREGPLSLERCGRTFAPSPYDKVALFLPRPPEFHLSPGTVIDVRVRGEEGNLSLNGWLLDLPADENAVIVEVYERYAPDVMRAAHAGILELAPARWIGM